MSTSCILATQDNYRCIKIFDLKCQLEFQCGIILIFACFLALWLGGNPFIIWAEQETLLLFT
jgi:hypothetical protein